MTGVTIYMEGGGNSAGGKRLLRRGMNEFLRELREKVRESRRRWRLVPCGGRQRTYETFANARGHAGKDEIVVLLVDAEAPVTAPTPVEHLRARLGDGWDLRGVDKAQVHLMVQTMETWIVADPDTLAAHYGQEFRANALPAADDLETVAKTALAAALDRATERTQKGRYHKIRHGADLLARIDPAKPRARCRHCDRLFAALGAAAAAG